MTRSCYVLASGFVLVVACATPVTHEDASTDRDHLDAAIDAACEDCLVCEGAVVPAGSIEHCGACDRACRADQVCESGACTCSEGSLDCDGRCADRTRDPAHCGACGRACVLGQLCVGGECICGTFGASDVCPGVGCVDLTRDEAHCGACGNACPEGIVCDGGECGCRDGASIVCSGTCVDPATEAEHCGGCDRACAPFEICVDGACGCPGESMACSGIGCVDLASDHESCGACGRACSAAEICVEGACRCPIAGHTYCPSIGACVDLRTDEVHCGSCNVACASIETCSGGSCRCPAIADTYCASEDRCTNLATDETSCGACGVHCPAAQVCSAGACRCPRSVQLYCAAVDSCIDPTTDPAHCGACGNACNPALACVGGTCQCAISGQTYCPVASECVDLASDESSCGSCGSPCPASSTCTTGRCVCDDPARTVCGGSCVDPLADPMHCGGCGLACRAGQVCIGAICECPVGAPFPEVRLSNESSNSLSVQAASDGTRAALVWSQVTTRTSWPDIVFQLVGPDGAPLGPAVDISRHISGTARQPDIVWTGTEWAVAWLWEIDTVYFVRLAPDGTPLHAPLRVTPPLPGGRSMYNVRLAHAGASGYGLLTDGDGVWFWPLGTAPTGPAVGTRIEGPMSHLTLAGAPDGRFGIVTVMIGTQFRIVNGDGTAAGGPFFVSGVDDQQFGELVHDGITWAFAARRPSSDEVLLRRGERLETSVLVGSDRHYLTSQPLELAVGSGELAIAFRSLLPASLWAARLTIPASAAGVPTVIAPPQPVAPGPDVYADRRVRFAATYVGTDALVLGWSDARWGGTRAEVYARAIALSRCN